MVRPLYILKENKKKQQTIPFAYAPVAYAPVAYAPFAYAPFAYAPFAYAPFAYTHILKYSESTDVTLFRSILQTWPGLNSINNATGSNLEISGN